MRGLPGDTVAVAVRVRDFQQLITAQGTLLYDSTVVMSVGVAPGALAGLSTGNFGTLGRRYLSFAWFDPAVTGQSLPDSATFFTVRFRIAGTLADSTPITLAGVPTALEFTAAGFVPVPHMVEAGAVVVGPPLGLRRDYNGEVAAFWPNPAHGQIQLSAAALVGAARQKSVTLVNLVTGCSSRRPVEAGGTVSLAGLPPGLYRLGRHRLAVQ